MRGAHARAPSGGDLLAIDHRGSPSEPGCAARSPGFLLSCVGPGFPVAAFTRVPRPERPAGGIGIRACLRNTLLRVRIPGGAPAFYARAQSRAVLLQLGCGKASPAARNEPSDGLWAARRGGRRSPAMACQRGCSSVDRAIALQAKDAGLIPALSTDSFSP